MGVPRREINDGFELDFGLNHLGHFELTDLLLQRLIETDGESRIVRMSSNLHRECSIDFDDIHHEASFKK